MVDQVEFLGLAVLRRDVGDVERGARDAASPRDLRQQQARQEAREQAAGPEDDQVGALDGLAGVVAAYT